MNRGLTKEIKLLLKNGVVGSLFKVGDIAEYVTADQKSVTNALNRLARLGELTRIGGRSNPEYKVVEQGAACVIETLLEAMANAEPALRRAAKLLRAMEED